MVLSRSASGLRIEGVLFPMMRAVVIFGGLEQLVTAVSRHLLYA
jgi:hypothetical protein